MDLVFETEGWHLVRARGVPLELIYHLKGEKYFQDGAQVMNLDEDDIFRLCLGKAMLPLILQERLELNSMVL